MADELPENPAEKPSPVPPVEPSTPAPAPPVPPVETPAPVPAPPPAAKLVVEGVKSETEIQLEGKLTVAERRALDAERRASELERDVQELKRIPSTPAPVKKEKRWRFPQPLIGIEDED